MRYDSSTIRQAWVRYAVATAFAATSMSWLSAASGEDSPQEVIVTGSRIRQDPQAGLAPLQVLTSEDIQRSGYVALGDFLQQLPISGSAINRTNNAAGNLGFPADGSGTSSGATELDLRYLGSKRTLVLVDGRRWVNGSSASGVSGAVDLNSIPADAIESIEVLQDGASTTYGSDAIAGVVNVITRKTYDGKLNLTGYYGGYGEGDGRTSQVSLTWTARSDSSRLLFSASYADQGEIFARDRDISRYAIPGKAIGLSSGTPQGAFFFQGANDIFNAITLNNGVVNSGRSAGGLPAYDPANPGSGAFHDFSTADRYNWQTDNLLAMPNKRVNVFVKGEKDLSEQVTFRATGAYVNRKSTAQAAPEPLFFGPGGGGGAWLENVVIPANQEYNPFGITLDSSNIDTIARRPMEAGPRLFRQDVDTAALSFGLDGRFTLSNRQWNWDVTAAYFRNTADQRKTGAFNARNLSIALGDPTVCAATPGCVPFNLFGGQGNGSGSITQSMLDYVTYVQKDQSEQELTDVLANLTGTLFDLPAGPLAVAAGAEYRKESGDFIPDSVVAKGESADVPASPISGSFNVKEYYAETVIPVLRELPLAHRLEMSGAARVSDYNLFGTNTVYKAALAWTPVSPLVIRGSWSKGFRAPNIGELFSTASRFDAAIADPCSGATGAVATRCQQLGVPAGYVAISQQVGLTTGGNTSLKPEQAKTKTAGFTLDGSETVASWGLGRTALDFNYYDINLTGAIQAPDALAVLTSCVNTLDPFYCNSITRSSTGSITRIDTRLQNIAGIRTKGIDWSLTTATQPQPWGQLRLTWSNNHLLDYTEYTPGPGGTIVATSRSGTELGVAGRGFPTFKSLLITEWNKGPWQVALTNRYISGITEPCGGFTASFSFLGTLALCSNPGTSTADPGTNHINAEVYTDLQFGWTAPVQTGRLSVQVGSQNLFNRQTPVCRSCTINGFDGTLYPLPGRFYYGRVSVSL